MSDADLIRAVEILNRHPGWDASPFAGDSIWLIPADMDAFTPEEHSELWTLGWIPFPGGGFCSVRWDRAKDGTVTERPDWRDGSRADSSSASGIDSIIPANGEQPRH